MDLDAVAEIRKLLLAYAHPLSRLEVSLKKVGGTFAVPVQINGAITLDFTVDSGAADVSVPADVFSTLIRTGTISETESSVNKRTSWLTARHPDQFSSRLDR